MNYDASLAYFLIALGLILMTAELFLPTGGILFVLGASSLIVGVVVLFAYDATQAVVTLVGLIALVTIAAPLLLRLGPVLLGRHFGLPAPDDDALIARMPGHLDLETLPGRYGKTLSPLRPSGSVEFDGKRIDSLSDGPLIEAGRWVRCIDVSGSRVLVRQVDGPPDLFASDEPTPT